MDLDKLVLLFILAGTAFYTGYTNIALAILVLGGVFFMVGGTGKPSKKPVPGGVNVRGAEMLDPIFIETTKGAPFRIPKSTKMKINPKWGSLNLIEKATLKGVGSVAKLTHGALFGRKFE